MNGSSWLLLAEVVDSLSAIPAWATSSLFGAVLFWVFYKHIPAKDKQISELIKDQTKERDALLVSQAVERDKDRESRHGLVDRMQVTIGKVHEMHRETSQLDREEFRLALQSIQEHCEKEVSKMIEAVRMELQLLKMPRSRNP